ALEAQKAGKVRFIGFTGHKDPRIHRKMLNKPYARATSQMPINPMDHFFRSFEKEVVPMCLARDVGIIGMQSKGGGGDGIILSNTKLTATHCLQYALSQPIATLVRGWMTMEQMMEDIGTAREMKPLAAADKAEILAMAKPSAGDGRYELFKTTQRFDNEVYRKMHGFPMEG
ncbi:MAG: aldo/keto reductase, partial [bacterium]|nr:aldo/keto reductase [bacterium]